jgi:hypothetical protein
MHIRTQNIILFLIPQFALPILFSLFSRGTKEREKKIKRKKKGSSSFNRKTKHTCTQNKLSKIPKEKAHKEVTAACIL